MKIVLAIIFVTSFIYAIEAGECQVYNRPDYLSLPTNINDKITVSDFTANLATLIGLSSDKCENPFFYSTNPLEIPSSIWLFHIEGLDRLSNNGISLQDNVGFDIDSILSKLRNTNNGDNLNIGSIIIISETDINNYEQILKNQISQMTKQTPFKYIVIVCDDCQRDKLQSSLKTVIDQIIANEPQSLIMTLTTKESARVRRARQAEQDSGKNVTIAPMYSDEYPTMFNLFFWTSLVFAVILISIVYVFLTLDPGSDTIIYRMTAPRLKVD